MHEPEYANWFEIPAILLIVSSLSDPPSTSDKVLYSSLLATLRARAPAG